MDIINIAQKHGAPNIQARTNTANFSNPVDPELKNTLAEIREFLRYLKTHGVKAPIVLSEFDTVKALEDKSGNR